MKLRIAFVIVLVLSAALVYGQAAAPAVTAQVPAGALGRYQLTVVVTSAANSEAWLVDTQTGDTWRRPTGGKWQFTGNPTQDPGTKPPAARTPASAPPILPER